MEEEKTVKASYLASRQQLPMPFLGSASHSIAVIELKAIQKLFQVINPYAEP
jgi:hypothetical protein